MNAELSWHIYGLGGHTVAFNLLTLFLNGGPSVPVGVDYDGVCS